MLTTKELCAGLIALDYYIKFVNYGNQPRIIVWTTVEDSESLSPVADVLMKEFFHYNLNYRLFDKLDTVGQIQLSTLIVQYANTPVESR